MARRRAGLGDSKPAQLSRTEQGARERTLARYRAILLKWATGRLPGWAREGADTNDLVQVVLLRAWHQMDRFADQPEAFKPFLRRILQNEVIDRIRSAKRHPERVELSEDLRDKTPSALDVVIEEEFAETYRAMLAGLSPRRREVSGVIR